MPAPPWKIDVGLEGVIDRWLSSGSVKPCLAADKEIPKKAVSYTHLTLPTNREV